LLFYNRQLNKQTSSHSGGTACINNNHVTYTAEIALAVYVLLCVTIKQECAYLCADG